MNRAGHFVDTHIGRTPVRGMGRTVSLSKDSQTCPSPGYTPSHAAFEREGDKYRKKAGGYVGGTTTSVQVKVTMTQPMMKGSKVLLVPIDEVNLSQICSALNLIVVYNRTCG